MSHSRRERRPEPVEAISAKDAFDEGRPVPQSVLDTLAWIDTKDEALERYESALREVVDVAATQSLARLAALRALYPEPRPCRSGPGCHNATPEGCCVDRGMEPM